jgi:hypothetical protein
MSTSNRSQAIEKKSPPTINFIHLLNHKQFKKINQTLNYLHLLDKKQLKKISTNAFNAFNLTKRWEILVI